MLYSQDENVSENARRLCAFLKKKQTNKSQGAECISSKGADVLLDLVLTVLHLCVFFQVKLTPK